MCGIRFWILTAWGGITERMTDRYHRYTVVARLVVAGSAMAGVVSFVASLPSYAQITFGLVIAVAVCFGPRC